MQVKVLKVDPRAKLPAYAHPGDAAMDLFALERTVLKPSERTAVRTGISMEIPVGYAALIWDKSGIAIKEGMRTLGGVIDSGYRGEFMVGMINLSNKEYVFEAGHKVAQMLIQKVETVELVESQTLTDSKRGAGGFGSTGK